MSKQLLAVAGLITFLAGCVSAGSYDAANAHDLAQGLSCDDWSDDVAVSIDSAYRDGVDRDVVGRAAANYISNIGGAGRDHFIFMYLISARYKVPLSELSSSDYPRFVRWECEQDWAGVGLSSKPN